jgi:hypothetical protein
MIRSRAGSRRCSEPSELETAACGDSRLDLGDEPSPLVKPRTSLKGLKSMPHASSGMKLGSSSRSSWIGLSESFVSLGLC